MLLQQDVKAIFSKGRFELVFAQILLPLPYYVSCWIYSFFYQWKQIKRFLNNFCNLEVCLFHF